MQGVGDIDEAAERAVQMKSAQRHFLPMQGGYIEIGGNHVRVAAQRRVRQRGRHRARRDGLEAGSRARDQSATGRRRRTGVERDEARASEAQCGQGRAVGISGHGGARVESTVRATLKL